MEIVRLWVPVLIGMLTALVPSVGIVFVALYRLGRVEKDIEKEKIDAAKALADVKAQAAEALADVKVEAAVKVKELQDQIEDLKDQINERLFEKGGELRYITVRACETEQSHCRDRMTVILNGINEHLAAIKRKVDCLEDIKGRVDRLEGRVSSRGSDAV